MIPFKIEKLTVEHLMIKQVSSALGGMITFVDEKKTKKNGGKEVYSKLKIPHNLARYFKKRYNTIKYLKPVLTAVTFYGDHVISLERHPLGNLGKKMTTGIDGSERAWISDSEHNLDTVIMPLHLKNDFFFDGTFLYTIKDQNVKEAVKLSSDGRFKSVKVDAIKLMHISEKDKLRPELRTALAYTPTGKKTFMTPPIWKSLANVGAQQFKKHKVEDEDDYQYGEMATDVEASFQFDKVDEFLSVNLGFALKAGRELSDVFGYDVIEPLCLDDLMIQMRTVNLPTIANEVKQTYDTGLPFSHAVAWLIGLVNRTKTLESFITLRTLLKHLTSKGVYRKGAFDEVSIFKDQNIVDVPVMTIEEAAKVEKIDTDTALQIGRISRQNQASGGVGGLYDAV